MRAMTGGAPPSSPPFAAAALLLGAALAAQEAHTGLAPGAVARYRRPVAWEVRPAAGDARGATARLELPGPDNPPVLFASEVDRPRRALARPPNDLRELARWVAFDLARGGRRARREVTAPAVVPFGDLHLRVQQGEVDAEGWQRIECTLRSAAPEAAGVPRALAARLPPRCPGRAAGTLTVTRRYAAEHGTVAAFRSRMELKVTAGGDAPELVVSREESWDLIEVLPARGRDFDGRVAAAIGRARDWLKRAATDPDAGDLGHRIERGSETRTTGRLALVLLALVHAEVPAADAVLDRGFAALRQRDIADTYSLALAILALEALHAPRHERRAILEGLQPGPRPRELPAADRALVQQWTDRLLGNADTGADRERDLRFSYTPRAEYDNSNTHFAALGLHAADLCGAAVPANAFVACARHFLADQERAEGRPRPLRLTPQAADDRAPGKATVAPRLLAAAGWPYRQGEEATGSMTAAGIASLALCRAALLRRGRPDRALLGEIDAALGAGFVWLADHWTMLGNPTTLRVEREWRTYHLYALERACEYLRVGLLDGIDWYHEGAVWLLESQGTDGSFPGWGYEDATAATCFGLLFLKKAALPVHTR
jgi:hypothetical protein